MKKIIPALIVAMALTCCVSKRSADKLVHDRDSLSVVLAEKESLLDDIFFSLNQISENLITIRERENIINASIADQEIQKHPAVQINEDIHAIDELLQQNRATIAHLQRSAAELKRAKVRIDELEKFIAQLNGQVEQRDNEIATLKDKLQAMDIQIEEMTSGIASLSGKVDELSGDKARLEGEVRTGTDRLNMAYYIVGPIKELLSKEIVYKSGFIGRTIRVNENHSLENFTQIDTRKFNEVIIGHRDVTVVTTHPSESYELVMGNKGVYNSLVIKDMARFWEYSKVLVICYK